MYAIETHDLSKSFGTHTAVSSLSLTIDTGEIFGFLGPNGAGKSTTIAILVDHLRPTTGWVRILGNDPQDHPRTVRRNVGILTDRTTIDGRLTARQHLQFAYHTYGERTNAVEMLDRIGLEDAADRRVRGFSTGMRQRLRIGLALVGDPPVLLLDEPLSGLDPGGQRWLRVLLEQERDSGTTIFVSSHRLDHVEALCDRIGILSDGRLRACGPPGELTGASDRCLQLTVPSWDAAMSELIRELSGVSGVSATIDGSAGISVTVVMDDTAVRESVIQACPDEASVVSAPPDLEAVYTAIAGDSHA